MCIGIMHTSTVNMNEQYLGDGEEMRHWSITLPGPINFSWGHKTHVDSVSAHLGEGLRVHANSLNSPSALI